MRSLLLIFISLLLIERTNAQITVGFDALTSEVQESKNDNKLCFVVVRASASPAAGAPVTVNITDALTGSASTQDYQFTNPTILTFTNTTPLVQAIAVTIKNDNVAEPDETINLTLAITGGGAAAGANTTHTITIKDANNSFLIPPVLLSIGGNFDYLDQKVTLKSLNFGANVFLPEVKGRFGLAFGFNQNRSFSFEADSTGRLNPNIPVTLDYLKYTTDKPVGKDSTWAVRRYSQTLRNAQIDNTSAYLGGTLYMPTWSNNNFKVYLQARGEVLKRTITSDLIQNTFRQDTVKILIRDFRTSVLSTIKGERQITVDGYFSGGVYAIYRNEDFWVRGQVLLGYTGHSTDILQGYIGLSKLFYYCEGSITENKLLGITLGVEVRGYLPNYVPYLNVTLSKAFTLSKLTDFLATK